MVQEMSNNNPFAAESALFDTPAKSAFKFLSVRDTSLALLTSVADTHYSLGMSYMLLIAEDDDDDDDYFSGEDIQEAESRKRAFQKEMLQKSFLHLMTCASVFGSIITKMCSSATSEDKDTFVVSVGGVDYSWNNLQDEKFMSDANLGYSDEDMRSKRQKHEFPLFSKIVALIREKVSNLVSGDEVLESIVEGMKEVLNEIQETIDAPEEGLDFLQNLPRIKAQAQHNNELRKRGKPIIPLKRHPPVFSKRTYDQTPTKRPPSKKITSLSKAVKSVLPSAPVTYKKTNITPLGRPRKNSIASSTSSLGSRSNTLKKNPHSNKPVDYLTPLKAIASKSTGAPSAVPTSVTVVKKNTPAKTAPISGRKPMKDKGIAGKKKFKKNKKKGFKASKVDPDAPLPLGPASKYSGFKQPTVVNERNSLQVALQKLDEFDKKTAETKAAAAATVQKESEVSKDSSHGLNKWQIGAPIFYEPQPGEEPKTKVEVDPDESKEEVDEWAPLPSQKKEDERDGSSQNGNDEDRSVAGSSHSSGDDAEKTKSNNTLWNQGPSQSVLKVDTGLSDLFKKKKKPQVKKAKKIIVVGDDSRKGPTYDSSRHNRYRGMNSLDEKHKKTFSLEKKKPATTKPFDKKKKRGPKRGPPIKKPKGKKFDKPPMAKMGAAPPVAAKLSTNAPKADFSLTFL